MAEKAQAAAPAADSPSGSYREKDETAVHDPVQGKPEVDDEKDEDIDALIDDLESEDGHVDMEEEGMLL